MNLYTISFQQLDKTKNHLAGGKGANLSELIKIPGIRVPEGFCISTEAYKRIASDNPSLKNLLDRLNNIGADERRKISEIGAAIRNNIGQVQIPEEIYAEITESLSFFDKDTAFAIRSSATAEDLPSASFAGQQDTYLNIVGEAAIIKYISKCWASLFTDRAITYRIQNGFDHRKVELAVIIQQMIFAQSSGILFTADPLSGNRKITSIDAGFGLGEALVAGLTNADNYKVRSAVIVERNIADKQLAIFANDDGGTKEKPLSPALQNKQVLTDEQIIELEQIGRTIERHFGQPQDIEWCLQDDIFYIVQSRPITTLFPIPWQNDEDNHVYISVGHQQMMTDAMKPLGISLYQITGGKHIVTAGGRLFVDVRQQLTTTSGRKMLLTAMDNHDPLIKDALTNIIERNFVKLANEESSPKNDTLSRIANANSAIENDPQIVGDLIASNRKLVEALKQKVKLAKGSALFELILADIEESKWSRHGSKNLDVIMAGINAASWLNQKMNEWLGEKNVADILSQSVDGNITSEMGLALLDLADVIRPYPEVIDYLQHTKDENFIDTLHQLTGGDKVAIAFENFLEKYGMRCTGEIDISRSRWIERPTILLPLLLNNIKNFQPGEAARKFERGKSESIGKENELINRIKELPNGEAKAQETKEMISRLRNFIGYREYPKYANMIRYLIYKQALLKEAAELRARGLIKEKEDIFYLRFEELQEAVQTKELDQTLIAKRKEEYKLFKKLKPPRVITSEGEIVSGKYPGKDFPENAIAGLAVSSGIIEGRARVILNMENAELEAGDILVTVFTDPSWTPLFVSIKGLVTEVGGLMTHGAVVAREYGLPAVVGVENATRIIKDGQTIRINGTEGYIEVLGSKF